MKKLLPFPRRGFFGLAPILSLVSIASVHAADIRTFGVIKRGNFLQAVAAMATPNPARPFEIVLFAEADDLTAINLAIVNPPSRPPISLPDANNFTFTDSRTSQAELASAYASGSYMFTFETANDLTTVALLNVPADAYPPAPLVANFPALQSVDITKSFTVSWQPFAGAAAGDSIQFRILDETDFPIFDASTFGLALDGTATSVSIIEGFLEPGKTYKGVVTFIRNAGSDTAAYPGAIGTVSFASQTQVPIKTTVGGNTGGPSLLFANPPDGAADVAVGSPIVFLFTADMQPIQSIVWTGNNLNPANFQYSWPQPNTLLVTYNGSLPANTTITYILNGFKDSAGNALAPVSGSFTTGSGMVNPNCPPPDDTKGGLSVVKSLGYAQTGPGAPALRTGDDAIIFFTASLQSPTV
ncbi:MAG: Ig-like domain-containing protein, partial [Verrucomicrobiales bacterium]|nr:Ig-like domain-containing protein [Verrucomicrobiales bacterium]